MVAKQKGALREPKLLALARLEEFGNDGTRTRNTEVYYSSMYLISVKK